MFYKNRRNEQGLNAVFYVSALEKLRPSRDPPKETTIEYMADEGIDMNKTFFNDSIPEPSLPDETRGYQELEREIGQDDESPGDLVQRHVHTLIKDVDWKKAKERFEKISSVHVYSLQMKPVNVRMNLFVRRFKGVCTKCFSIWSQDVNRVYAIDLMDRTPGERIPIDAYADIRYLYFLLCFF